MKKKESTRPDEKINSTLSLWLIGIVVVLALWVGSYYYLTFCRTDLSWSEKGSLGDMFGTINALFAGLAFVAVVITLYLQSREILATKTDIAVQKFEAKFFQLINIQNEILKGIGNYMTVGGQHIPIQGRMRIVKLYEEYVSDYKTQYMKDVMATPADIIMNSYKLFFDRNQPEIGHYFRHLYNIVAFVDRATFLTFKQKKSYTNLIRAQMSSHEMLLLFYNCLSEKGIKEFKALVERYSLLEHMPDDRLAPITLKLDHDNKGLYERQAFQEDNNKS